MKQGTIVLLGLDTDQPEQAVVLEALTKEETKACGMWGQQLRVRPLSGAEIIDISYGWEEVSDPGEEALKIAAEFVRQYNKD